MNWKGKKVLITGGTSGIGKQLVNDLSEKGALISFCGLETKLVNQITKLTGAKGWVIDLTKDDELVDFFHKSISYLNGIDILINNAGYVIAEDFLHLERSDFEHMFALNSIAPARLSQLAIPYFIKQNLGDIVNIGATGGSYAFPKGTAYSASKSALSIISKNIQLEHRKNNIRAFHIDPSWVTDTNNFNYGTPIPKDDHKLNPSDISHMIIHMLEMNRRGFIPQISVWGTQP